MSELELRLQELREEIAWPETPGLEPDLRPAPAPRRRWRRELAIALAVLIVILAGVLAVSPGARSAFLEVFHIRGATVERVERLPKVPTNGIPLGRKVSREEAERRVGFRQDLLQGAIGGLSLLNIAPSHRTTSFLSTEGCRL